MSTTVLINNRSVTLTEEGWKSGDPALDSLCNAAAEAGSFHWDVNPHQQAADTLAAALGGRVLSVEPLDDQSPADALN